MLISILMRCPLFLNYALMQFLLHFTFCLRAVVGVLKHIFIYLFFSTATMSQEKSVSCVCVFGALCWVSVCMGVSNAPESSGH